MIVKWFEFPPHIVHHVVRGLEQLAKWIEQALAWVTREFM